MVLFLFWSLATCLSEDACNIMGLPWELSFFQTQVIKERALAPVCSWLVELMVHLILAESRVHTHYHFFLTFGVLLGLKFCFCLPCISSMATVDNSKYYIIFLFSLSVMSSFSISGLTEMIKMRRANWNRD